MRERMLIVTEALEMNGVLRSLLDFMEAMDQNRYDISLFCFDAFKPEFVQLPDYVKVLPEIPACYMARAPFARIVRWALCHGAFVSLLKRLAVSLLQNRFPRRFVKQDLAKGVRPLKGEWDVAIAYSMGMTWRFVAEKVVSRRKLMWLHTDVRFGLQALTWRKYSPYLRSADALICVSDAICDMMRCKFGTYVRRIETIHSAVDAAAVVARGNEPLRHPRNEKFRIVTVGRYCEPKNQIMIPRVAEELRKSGFCEFEWIMAGPGSALFKTDDPNLVYLDSLSNPYPLMKSADVYVQPSTYEGWGLTVTEALCLGKYVIVSDVPSFIEQLSDLRRGEVVPLDPKSFARAVLTAAEKRCYCCVPPYDCPYTSALTRIEFERIVS